jgi:hypothetical protein
MESDLSHAKPQRMPGKSNISLCALAFLRDTLVWDIGPFFLAVG